jgi:hypothetical protein
MWRDFRRHGWRAWLLPATLVLTAGMQVFYLSSYPRFSAVLGPVIVTICALAAIVLVAVHLLSYQTAPAPVHSANNGLAGASPGGATCPGLLRVVVVPAFLALLLAPFVWSSYTSLNVSTVMQAPGPQPQTTFQAYLAGWTNVVKPNQPHDHPPALSKLDRYLLLQRGQATFIVATLDANLSAPIILATNQPVLTVGGFSGNDPTLTQQQFITLINDGAVRFFLTQIGQKTKNANLVRWVSVHCSAIQAYNWVSGRIPPGVTHSPNGEELLDCSRRL